MSAPLLMTGFAVLVAAAVTLELSARLGRPGVASLGDVADAVTAHPVGRATALAVWLWLGWHLFVR